MQVPLGCLSCVCGSRGLWPGLLGVPEMSASVYCTFLWVHYRGVCYVVPGRAGDARVSGLRSADSLREFITWAMVTAPAQDCAACVAFGVQISVKVQRYSTYGTECERVCDQGID